MSRPYAALCVLHCGSFWKFLCMIIPSANGGCVFSSCLGLLLPPSPVFILRHRPRRPVGVVSGGKSSPSPAGISWIAWMLHHPTREPLCRVHAARHVHLPHGWWARQGHVTRAWRGEEPATVAARRVWSAVPLASVIPRRRRRRRGDAVS